MRNEERINLVNSIEKIFFDQAFQIFNEKHPGVSNRIVNYLEEDDAYLLKYYTNFTRNWLNFLGEDELRQILTEKMANENLSHHFSGSGRI